jgi:hypothetical protein
LACIRSRVATSTGKSISELEKYKGHRKTGGVKPGYKSVKMTKTNEFEKKSKYEKFCWFQPVMPKTGLE